MGDLVRVDIHPRPELSTGEFGRRIDYDGNLDLPLLGATAVAGLTVSEARAALQARADRFLRNATVSISVIEFAPRLFYILGEVARGGVLRDPRSDPRPARPSPWPAAPPTTPTASPWCSCGCATIAWRSTSSTWRSRGPRAWCRWNPAT